MENQTNQAADEVEVEVVEMSREDAQELSLRMQVLKAELRQAEAAADEAELRAKAARVEIGMQIATTVGASLYIVNFLAGRKAAAAQKNSKGFKLPWKKEEPKKSMLPWKK